MLQLTINMHWNIITEKQCEATNARRVDKKRVYSGTLVAVMGILVGLCTFTGVSGLEIKTLRVPTGVQSGSSDPLVLDCDYTYEDREKSGLVVKWYRESGPSDNKTIQQVYQWITSLRPQDLGILKGRLDLDYEASADPYSKHRALRILQPTTNLTGIYRCHVSTNYNDAIKSQKMIIYAPAKDLDLTHTKIEDNSVNISCSATGMYPEPFAEMIITKGRKTTRTVVNDATQVIVPNEGHYDITVYKVFEDASLAAETQFECFVTVPETTYQTRKTLTYYPGHDVEPFSEANSANRRLVNRNRGSTDGSLAGAQPTTGAANGLFFLHRYFYGLLLLNLFCVFRSHV